MSIKGISKQWYYNYPVEYKAIDLLQAEPLTDIEQRIFLAAMSREENACKEVCADGSDGGVDLVAVCHRVERKVKKALWE